MAGQLPLRIGYLPFYVDYYEGICADFAREKREVAQRCANTLARYGEVIWDQALSGDVETATHSGNWLAGQDIDCIVVVTTIAVFSAISYAALRDLNVPVVIWNAQQIEAVGAGYSMVDIVRNTGQIGAQALGNVLVREGRAFNVVTGHEGSLHTQEQLEKYFRRAGVARTLRKACLLSVGSSFPMMTDVELEAGYLARHIGARVVQVGEAGLNEAYASVPPDSLGKEMARICRDCDVEDITTDELSRSLRLSEALDTLVRVHGADAGTLNCHGVNCLQNPAIGITACYSLGRQNSFGRPFTCTGDLPTALAMLLLKTLTGAAMYTELQVMDMRREAIVIANSGEGEAVLKREGSPLRVCGNANFTGLHGRGASFAYALKSGPATIASLTPTPRGRHPFRLIVAEGEILEEALPDAGALAGFFRFADTDLHQGYTRWMEAGAVHHAGTTSGHWADELKEIASMLNIEFTGI